MVVTLRALLTLPVILDGCVRREQVLAARLLLGLHRNVQLLVLGVLGKVGDVGLRYFLGDVPLREVRSDIAKRPVHAVPASAG